MTKFVVDTLFKTTLISFWYIVFNVAIAYYKMFY
jgi:hypothetical protein